MFTYNCIDRNAFSETILSLLIQFLFAPRIACRLPGFALGKHFYLNFLLNFSKKSDFENA